MSTYMFCKGNCLTSSNAVYCGYMKHIYKDIAYQRKEKYIKFKWLH